MDQFSDRTDFEVPIATLEGLEFPHFIGDLNPVSQILIFHYSLLDNLATLSVGVKFVVQ